MTVSLAELGDTNDDPLVRNGRYQIAYKGEKSWQRWTNFAPILENQYSLIEWKQRKTLLGAPAVLHKIAEITNYKDEIALVEEAMEAAGANIKRDYGSAVHTATEDFDNGLGLPADPLLAKDVAAYGLTMAAHEITIVEIEQVTVCPEMGCAGRFDRIVNHLGTTKILDLKTGTLHPLQIAIQLAGYAHAEVIYNPEDKTFRPMPAVSQIEALVAHIPMHSGRCDIYSVDIELGWEYAHLTKRVRDEVRKAPLTRKLKAQLRPAPSAVDARQVPPPAALPADAGVVEGAARHAPPTPATSDPTGATVVSICVACRRNEVAGPTHRLCERCAANEVPNTAQIALFS